MSQERVEELLEIIGRLRARLLWVFNGLEHFMNEDDEQQVKHLKEGILDELEKSSL